MEAVQSLKKAVLFAERGGRLQFIEARKESQSVRKEFSEPTAGKTA